MAPLSKTTPRKVVQPPKRAVGYVRVSTEDQKNSPDAQKDAITNYCALRDLPLARIVIDHGVSAGHPLSERPGGAQVLEMVQQGKASAVVAYKLDRLFRDASDCLIVTKHWDEVGASLHLIDLGGASVDTSSPMGRFFLTVMAAAAEMERNLTRERTRLIAAHKRKNHERIGTIPYGFRLASDKKHIEPDPWEQKIIGWIRQGRKCGWSVPEIIDWLNEHDIKARGKRWHITTVRRILVRETE